MSHSHSRSPKSHAAENQNVPSDDDVETQYFSDSILNKSKSPANLPLNFGRYEVQKQLGAGTVGNTYLARDSQQDRLVALKIFDVTAPGSNEVSRRLNAEAVVLAQIDHPSLCKVSDFGKIDGQYFIATQFVAGETLRSQLESRCPSVDQAISMILQLASGLSTIHRLVIFHGNLNLENIVIDRRGLPVIVGFGSAKISTTAGGLTPSTLVGTTLASSEHLSSDQVDGVVNDGDLRADIAALGAILFQLLTGRQASGSSPLTGDKPSWPRLSPAGRVLPLELVAIGEKMLARNRADQYQSIAEVTDQLLDIDFSIAPLTSVVPDSMETKSLINVGQLPLAPGAEGETSLWVVTDQPKCPADVSITKSMEHSPRISVRRPQWSAAWKGLALLTVAAILIASGIFLNSPVSQRNTVAQPLLPELPNESQTDHAAAKPAAVAATLAATAADAGWQGWPAAAPPPAIAPFSNEQARSHQLAWAKYLQVEVEYTNSIGIKFHLVPPGEYLRGNSPTELARIASQLPKSGENWLDLVKFHGPQHRVILSEPIFLGDCEVTQREYAALMRRNPSAFAKASDEAHAAGKVADIDTNDFPVERVSWDDAAAFCVQLSRNENLEPFYRYKDKNTPNEIVTGNGYRLPTEAEWEFACRAGTTGRYWIGDDDAELAEVAWFRANSDMRVHAAGTLKANPFGLFDMHGNVWEWVQDGWNPESYELIGAQDVRNI